MSEGKEYEKLNNWLYYDPTDEEYIVVHKDKEYKFREIQYGKVLSAQRRATRIKQDGSEKIDIGIFELILISECLVKPKLTESDLKELPAGLVMKFKAVINKLLDLESFLSG